MTVYNTAIRQARKDYFPKIITENAVNSRILFSTIDQDVESPCGLTTCRESHWARVQRTRAGGRQRQGPGRADPRHRRLVLGTWNVTSLVGKEPEPELVREVEREVERYQLDMVGLTSTNSTGSGTKLLERGWTLSFPGVAQGVRCQLSGAVLQFSSVNERVASMRL